MNNSELESIKKPIIVVISLLIILSVAVLLRALILDAPVVKLSTAPALYGQVSQSLLNGVGGNKILSANNFTLKNVHYFDNNTWAVAGYVALNDSSDNGSVLLQKVGPFFQDVLGPGTAFPSNIQQGLPSDVYSYLQSKGLIYEISD